MSYTDAALVLLAGLPLSPMKCLDCKAKIDRRSRRCRECCARRLGLKATGNRPFGHVAMTRADIMRRYRARLRGEFVIDNYWPFPHGMG